MANYDRKLRLGLVPMEKYEDRPHWEFTTAKNGQLKLLLTETEFLIKAHKAGIQVVVYAGAASGYHIGYLAEMFPQFMFWLFDPRPFSPTLRKHNNIKIYEQFFTLKTLKAPTKPWAFISDVRTGQAEHQVKLDMQMQEEWVRHYRPTLSMLKFRLPWDNAHTTYFAGTIMIQPYTGISTETRLIVKDPASTHIWNNRLYEESLYYFQRHTRPANYSCGFMDSCYDCWTFVHIISKYRAQPYSCERTLEEFYEWFGFRVDVGSHMLYWELPRELRMLKLEKHAAELEIEEKKRMASRKSYFAGRDILNAKKKINPTTANMEWAYLRRNIGELQAVSIRSDVAATYVEKLCELYPFVQFKLYSSVMLPIQISNLEILYDDGDALFDFKKQPPPPLKFLQKSYHR